MPVERSRQLIGNVWRYLSVEQSDSGNGGSQPGTARVIGPYNVVFADLPDLHDFVDVVTLPIGSAVLDWWVDPDTFEVFDSDTIMGQGPDFNAAAAASEGDSDLKGSLGEPAHASDEFAYSAAFNAITAAGYGRFNNTQTPGLGTRQRTTLLVTQTADPIRIYNISAGTAGGNIDLYFLIATDMTAPSVII